LTSWLNMQWFDEFSLVLNFRLLSSMVVALSIFLAGCSNPKLRAPVEERKVGAMRSVIVAESSSSEGVASTDKPINRPGFYTVKPGDTLLRIALEHGQNWRDIARWNGVTQPNLIEVGQALRVAPPQGEPASSPSRVAKADVPQPAIASAGSAISEPLPHASAGAPPQTTSSSTAQPVAAIPTPSSSLTDPAPVAAQSVSPASASVATSSANKDDDGLTWVWPAAGSLMVPFEEGKTRGVAIGGKQGDPVWAAGDGRVVYAGSGLRGYGNLIILKHSNTYLTAYAHNSSLLVKEDQVVRRGQKIAEMGASDAERIQLHFEIRKQGKPVDPLKLLPPR